MAELKSHQRDWVESKVRERHGVAAEVNRPLIAHSVPPYPFFPDIVIRCVQYGVTSPQVDFMMDESAGRPEFSFQMKLVAPNNRSDLIATLINGQRRKILGSSSERGDFLDQLSTGSFRPTGHSKVKNPEWFWELGQGEQTLEIPQPGDSPELPLPLRVRNFLSSMPTGMEGTDRWSWATRMAEYCSRGQLFDSRFKAVVLSKDSRAEFSGSTILDGEGNFADGLTTLPSAMMVGGAVHTGDKWVPTLGLSSIRGTRTPDLRNTVMRASISGPITHHLLHWPALRAPEFTGETHPDRRA